mmetsp:Transcript_12336/g.49688  ORF Transcript_12336/g.49688 Transcript_12336/m.49688 type:complete len:125 (-) Transcript_12336:358-732(-)
MKPTLSLYRRILFAAKRFPSKKREGIYQEIRAEFRRNKTLDPNSEKARQELQVAADSLKQLEPYTKLDPDAPDWSITLHQQPMPPPPGWKQDINSLNPLKNPPRAPEAGGRRPYEDPETDNLFR